MNFTIPKCFDGNNIMPMDGGGGDDDDNDEENDDGDEL